ncbi:GNAT family N-acetyltransferase [Dermacoccaceae bacterium W4C1]
MDVELRPATEAEHPRLAALRWQWDVEYERDAIMSYPEYEALFLQWLADRRATHTPWVAVAGEAVVAMAYLCRVERSPSSASGTRWVAEVQTVYVHPDHRSQGIGSRLVTAMLDQARADGARRVMVHAADDAVQVYRRLGFAPDEVLMQIEWQK